MTKQVEAQLQRVSENETCDEPHPVTRNTGRPARPKVSDVGRRARLATLVDRFHDGDYRGITFDNLAPVTISELPEGCELYATAPDTEDRYHVAEGGAF